MKAEHIKGVLSSIGKKPTKRLGQNFLLDESVISRQVDFAEISSEDTVLEIGPGLGNLTEAILATGAKVVAVEKDPDFVRFLQKRFGPRLQLIQADAVKAFLPEFDKVVSNLPYQISSPIVFKLLEIGFESAVLMLQLEFAERMVAKPGTQEYGRLSVGVYYRADCEILFKVPPSAFWPQPRVDSCVVRLVPKEPPFVVGNEAFFFEVVRAIFSHRRKKIANSLASDGPFRRTLSTEVVGNLGSLPYASKRAEELTPEMMGQLADALLAMTASNKKD
ncbi:MAG TPA: 16S rRNA (adenine(1518)-N(6)/adenine(1519)-N(6))-dimethyltransferase RsmA [Thermoplasmata archaeon]